MISARWRSLTPIVVERRRRRSSFTTSSSACNRLIGGAICVILPRESVATQILVDIYGTGY
jgi:hypothetical protein